MIYAYQWQQHSREILVKAHWEDGSTQVWPFPYLKKAKEIMAKWDMGDELVWVDKYWDHPGIKDSQDQYLLTYGHDLR